MVGGGDNALTEILFLERFAKKIHLIHRRDQFRAANTCRSASWPWTRCRSIGTRVVTEFQGAIRAGSPGTPQRQDRGNSTLPVTGAFIAIGMVPNTAWLGISCPWINGASSLPTLPWPLPSRAVFAAGDVRSKLGAANFHRRG